MSSRVGSLLIIGFEGTVAPPDVLARIAAGRIGGVCLFTRNLGSFAEIAALVTSLQAAVPSGDPPLVVSIDQEGGRVQRIRAPLTLWPPMATVAARGDEDYTTAVGRAIGEEVAAFGFNVDYAPVLDVRTNPVNDVIGDRAFGTDAAGAAAQALAFWRGLEASGVRGCGKHFPGHGDTALDSHLELPRVVHPELRLREVELAPFRTAVKAGVPMIMTAHVVYPAIDPRPATMSHRWLTEILRGEMGFQGVILSDDLDMKAVADGFVMEDVVRDAFLAGCDAFLACRSPEIQARAEAALERLVTDDPKARARFTDSDQRMRGFRASLRGAAAPNAHTTLAAKKPAHDALAARAKG